MIHTDAKSFGFIPGITVFFNKGTDI